MPGRSARVVTLRIAVLAAALLLLLTVSTDALGARSWARAGAQDGKGFAWSFSCDGVGGLFRVDAATVWAEGNIPSKFHLLGEDTGSALLFLAAFDCDPAIVDGATAPFLYGLATVFLDSHDGSYDFFKFTEDPLVHSRFERMGVWIRQLHDMSVDIGGTPMRGVVDIPWNSSPFSLTADIAPGVVVPDLDIPNSPSHHWSQGPHGTVYGADNNCEGWANGAVVTATTRPGTVMSRILGGDRVTAPGVFLSLSAAADVDFEGQTQLPEECPTWG